MKIKEKIKKHKYLIIVILVSLLMLSPLYSDKYYKGHDSNYHINVIKAYSKSIHISKFELIPKDVLPKIAKDFGYGTGIFYPQLPHMVATYIYKIISFFHFTVSDAMKLTTILVTLTSTILIYFLSLKMSKNKKIALISAIIYSIMPYRLSEIFVRDAFAEQFTFIFMPMILLGLFALIDKNYKKFYLLFIIGYIGLIYSHLVMTLFFTIFLIPFFVIYFKDIFKLKNISKLIISALIILIMTSTFTVPMLYHKAKGHYVVFEDTAMAGIEKIERYQLQLSDFLKVTGIAQNQINTLERQTNIQFYIPASVILFLGLTFYYYKNIENKKAFIYFFIIIIISIFMSTKLCNWKILPEFLYMIQFPWRLETMLVVAISVISPIWLLNFKKENYFNIVCIILSIILISIGMSTINFNSNKNLNTSKLEFDKFSNNGMGSAQEYLPMKTKNNKKYYKNRDNEIIVLNDKKANTVKIYDKTPDLEFELINVNKQISVELPRLFYYGYELTNKQTGEHINLYESKNGFIQADINTNGIYTLKYIGLEITKILNIIKVVTLLIIILYLICIKKKRSK